LFISKQNSRKLGFNTLLRLVYTWA